ncbi:MAG TPA: biotin--[acetyl-CoA-carboxylase] ligase [Solirubrobacteraceae bacterium]|jgi:BirA family biotin operon repressor/biotin-[acetyl-CoA-carboxylase] ligase
MRRAELGRPRLHLRRTDSTNERARALAHAGAHHGTLVTADEQTAGRGRQGRRWVAPPRSSLLMSLLLRPSPPAERLPGLLPLLAAVAVCDVVGEDARVKWPNDVVYERDGALVKLAGILIEGRPQDGWMVLGVGLNVALELAQLPPELACTAATLGRGPDAIEPLLAELLDALERRLAGPPQQTLSDWRSRDALLGRQLAWNGGSGSAEGVDDEGRLLVRQASGELAALDSGEVHLV